MRLLAFLAMASIALSGCVSERPRDNNTNDRPQEEDGGYNNWEDDHDDRPEEDGSPACAPAPSGAGTWEDVGNDGLHCNYHLDDGDDDDWAYGLNSSESYCIEASWAPHQPDGGSVKMWEWDGNKGCDWVIPW